MKTNIITVILLFSMGLLYAQTSCSHIQLSNNFENGSFIEEGGQKVANDFFVSTNTLNFSVHQIIVNLFSQGGIESVDILFYENGDNIPTTQIGETIENLVPTSQEIIGTAFGFEVHEVILDLPDDLNFPGTGTEEIKYWMQLVAKPVVPGTQISWEDTRLNPIGSLIVFDNDGNSTNDWIRGDDNEWIYDDGVFSILGDCEYITGCFAVEHLRVDGITDVTADFLWDDAPTALAGFDIAVFYTGDDPNTNPPIYSDHIPAGTYIATADGLIAETTYDVYITSDCGSDNSIMVKETFTTAPTPPLNDDVCDALPLLVDDPCSGAPYTSFGATPQENEPEGDCFFEGPQKSVWFTFEAPYNGSVLITTDFNVGTHPDTQLALYESPTDCAAMTTFSEALACNQIGGGPLHPLNAIIETQGLTPGETYYIQLSGYNNTEGTFCIEVQTGDDCPQVENLSFSDTTQTTAHFSWDEIANASAGYILSIFLEGDDPATDPAVYTETLPSGTLETTASGLEAGIAYDAYIIADCDTLGISQATALTFFTEAAPEICDGNFTDSGGTNDTYEDNEHITTTLYPDTSGNAVTLTFTYVDIEADTFGNGSQGGCWDFLTIYDGENTSAPLLAQTLCGEESTTGDVPSVPSSNLSVGDSFTSSDPVTGALTVVFSSNQVVRETGWLATISCAQLSIDDPVATGFNFFPNPTTQKLSVIAKNPIETILFYNMLGQKVLEKKPRSLKCTIDLSSLNSGTYIMKSVVNGNSYSHKIMKK